MRTSFTTAEAISGGTTSSAIKWSARTQRVQRITRGIYLDGPQDALPLERALAIVRGLDGIASASLAGILYGFDSIRLKEPFVTIPSHRTTTRSRAIRRQLPDDAIVEINGVHCTSARQTLIDLARFVDDTIWEQALESALRRGVVSVHDFDTAAAVRGVRRIRRVLAARQVGAPPTESLLETLMIQLIRGSRGLPTPLRQVVVRNAYGSFVARVDLAWPDRGVFIELDGQHHEHQPVHDARRETAVIAATGWFPARFTWDELTRVPQTSLGRLAEILATSDRIRSQQIG